MKIGIIASRKLARETFPEEAHQPTKGTRKRSVGERFSVFSFLGKAGKKWKWSARVSPLAEPGRKRGRRIDTQTQKMTDNRCGIEEVEDMETEMSPECKLPA